MKRNVIVFGIILGLILTGNMVYMCLRCYNNPYFKSNDIIGYAAMIAVFALMFVGIKNYRDKYLDGFISFGKAFKTGFLMALLASTMYVVGGLILIYQFIPDFIDKYIEHVMYMAREKGASTAELEKKAADMANFKEMYKNPLFVIFVSYMEVLPIGTIVALISALILKRKPKIVL
jgi:ethanolamine transporter EutH